MSKLALISVSDKSGLLSLGRGLVELGFTLLSTGGTARALQEAGLPVTAVSEYTGASELMDGRVKTLHPQIHGGILGDRVRHAEEAAAQGVRWIDLVVVNLYPFEAAVKRGASVEEALDQIDIGGPTMVRAAAKNHRHVTVVVDPGDYPRVLDALRQGGPDLAFRRSLALRAFRHTARYDAVISGWLAEVDGEEAPVEADLPPELGVGLRQIQALRYGENPHQRAAFYGDSDRGRSLSRVIQRQGKELSFNNLADLDAALRVVYDLEDPAAVVVKHHNPCGCAVAADPAAAFLAALAGDPKSAFGGIVAFNRPLDVEEVRTIRGARTFFEVLAAPGFTDEALEALRGREKLRVMEVPADWGTSRPAGMDGRRVQGGWLLQGWDLGAPLKWEVVTSRAPTEPEVRALRFAWAVCRNVKSNAIVLARAEAGDLRLNGVGAGQMSRVDSVELAIRKATAPVQGSVLASDAFFPFADGVQAAAEAGVTAIIQPGGSIRDAEVIAAADAAGVAMVSTGARHFRH